MLYPFIFNLVFFLFLPNFPHFRPVSTYFSPPNSIRRITPLPLQYGAVQTFLMVTVIFLCSALPRRLSFVPKNSNGGLSDGGVLMFEEQDEAVLDHFPGNLIC